MREIPGIVKPALLNPQVWYNCGTSRGRQRLVSLETAHRPNLSKVPMHAHHATPSDVLDLPAAEFVRTFLDNPSLAEHPEALARHQKLTARASVCSYCGVGCPYGVETDAQGRDDVVPLSPLGLCVKGRTSLLTGGEVERARRLQSRNLRDDRIRAPMLRGHDGKMREVSWEEALDRAAWLLLHAREWVGPEAVAVYGNGQKTLEAIWMASLYKLVFRLPTIGANSEHCLASAGAAQP